MPTAIELTLSSTAAMGNPDQWHGLACALLRTHTDVGARLAPMSVWPTRRESERSDGALLFRVNWLPDEDPPTPRFDNGSVRLGAQRHRVLHLTTTRESYGSLVSPSVVDGRVTFSFESPTYFSRGGRDYPLPDPELVFGNLVRRWDSFCPEPLRIGKDLGDTLLASLVVEQVNDLSTCLASAAHDSKRRGFRGVVGFATQSSEPRVRQAFAALCAAAPYFGVGAQTSRGFGVVQRLDG